MTLTFTEEELMRYNELISTAEQAYSRADDYLRKLIREKRAEQINN